MAVRLESNNGLPVSFSLSQHQVTVAFTFTFTDCEFPPDSRSIDGGISNTKMSDTTIELNATCNCQLKAKLGKVSKDGPNHGRQFYCCSKRICNYFKWANIFATKKKYSSIVWNRFRSIEGWSLFQPSFSAHDILQGGVGDCWFLSALSVLAERNVQFIKACIVDEELRDDRGIKFRLFFNGYWREVTIDNQLPCKHASSSELVFSKHESRRLWVPFIEKAYAKLHGSYEAISGGYIHEALLDLTGAPCEVIDFGSCNFRSEETWERLVSFHSCGFPMGCSTSSTGEGIVGHHAYSILEVKEAEETAAHTDFTKFMRFDIRDFDLDLALLLSQQHQHEEGGTYYLQQCNEYEHELDDVISIHSSPASSPLPKRSRNEYADVDEDYSTHTHSCIHTEQRDHMTDTGHLRLLRIRNPWGRGEWTGASVADAAAGTFWMSYHDFLRRFDSIDVCKARDASWQAHSVEDLLTLQTEKYECDSYFRLTVRRPTWTYLTLLQKTKRGKHRTGTDHRYWYSSLCMLVRSCTWNGTVRSYRYIGMRCCTGRRDSIPLEFQPLEAGTYEVFVLRLPRPLPPLTPGPGASNAYRGSVPVGQCETSVRSREPYIFRVYSASHIDVEQCRVADHCPGPGASTSASVPMDRRLLSAVFGLLSCIQSIVTSKSSISISCDVQVGSEGMQQLQLLSETKHSCNPYSNICPNIVNINANMFPGTGTVRKTASTCVIDLTDVDSDIDVDNNEITAGPPVPVPCPSRLSVLVLGGASEPSDDVYFLVAVHQSALAVGSLTCATAVRVHRCSFVLHAQNFLVHSPFLRCSQGMGKGLDPHHTGTADAVHFEFEFDLLENSFLVVGTCCRAHLGTPSTVQAVRDNPDTIMFTHVQNTGLHISNAYFSNEDLNLHSRVRAIMLGPGVDVIRDTGQSNKSFLFDNVLIPE